MNTDKKCRTGFPVAEHGTCFEAVEHRFVGTLALGPALSTASAKDVVIPVKELPKAVSEAIAKAHPNAVMVAAEKDLKRDGSLQLFEVKIRDGEVMKELTVLADGTITETEKDD